MKKIILFLIFVLPLVVFAQRRVALQHQGSTTIFGGTQPFIDAYNASSSGDTIYLPGGGYSPPTISKRLCIIGAGIHPDSSNVTNRTILLGDLYIDSLGSGSHFEGFVVNGGIIFTNNQKVDSITIRRIYSNYIDISGVNPINKSTGLRIVENFINGSIACQHTNGIFIANNVCQNISYVTNGWIVNNLIYYTGYGYNLIGVNESLLENNYFEGGWGFTACINNTFNYNAFGWNPTSDVSNVWNNSYTSVSSTSLFYNYQWSSSFAIANYHLQNPLLFLGSTGTEIGLYGGYNPIKDGSVPMNPHFQQKNIAPNTDPSGNLNITIKVAAQNN